MTQRRWWKAAALSASALGILAAACGAAGDPAAYQGAVGDPGYGRGGTDPLPLGDGGGPVPFEGSADPDASFDPDAGCTATVVVPTRMPVDIVFAIDQSHSMADEIERVQANINRFAALIAASGLDYQVIALGASGTTRCGGGAGCEDVPNLRGSGVSGDVPNELCVPAPLGLGPAGACGSNEPRFHALDHFPFGIQSNNALSLIQGMYPADYDWSAGGRPGQPAGGGWSKWARAEAYKFLVAISDDDATYPKAPASAAEATAATCLPGMGPADCWDHQLFHAREPNGALAFGPEGTWGTEGARKYVYNAVVGIPAKDGATTDGKPTSPCIAHANTTAENRAVNQGSEHRRLAAKTGGVVESICSEDWSAVLSHLADALVTRIGCSYNVSLPADQALDPAKVLVRYVAPDGAIEVLDRVLSKDGCSGNPRAFYFDRNDRPTVVNLCAGACESIGAAPNGRVEVALGCLAPLPK